MTELRDNLTGSEVELLVALTELDTTTLTLTSTRITLTEAKEKIVSTRNRLSTAIREYGRKGLDKDTLALWAKIGEMLNEFNILRHAAGIPVPPTPMRGTAQPLPPAPAPAPASAPRPRLTISTETAGSDEDHQLPMLSDEFVYPSQGELRAPSPAESGRDGSYDGRQKKNNKRTYEEAETPTGSSKKTKVHLQGPGVRPPQRVNREASTSKSAGNTPTNRPLTSRAYPTKAPVFLHKNIQL
ncbi:hypothetical protein BDN72DRAFT_904498 [Pluteus cervinus]|uniref:Uncharacterized protein n=1 Tax=Pluteus cervinus TaxID=181527 RepID=A0ACD3A5P4_9AGAR|nr:hypothetical protein BDN72DRAFT_904498 [Pluteus cervinus]